MRPLSKVQASGLYLFTSPSHTGAPRVAPLRHRESPASRGGAKPRVRTEAAEEVGGGGRGGAWGGGVWGVCGGGDGGDGDGVIPTEATAAVVVLQWTQPQKGAFPPNLQSLTPLRHPESK